MATEMITGPEQVPASTLSAAGIQPQFLSILAWRPPGELVPSAPILAEVLYAFRGQAYVIWHPAINEGDTPIVSYTVWACPMKAGLPSAACPRSGARSVTVPIAQYQRDGYAVVSGLTDGKRYVISVTANNNAGPGTASLPSLPVTPTGRLPKLLGKPKSVNAQAGHGEVSLLWYPPRGVGYRPVLGYIVTGPGHVQYVAGGLSRLILSNRGARDIYVVGGLKSGRWYKFSISAITPAGLGPAIVSRAVKTR